MKEVCLDSLLAEALLLLKKPVINPSPESLTDADFSTKCRNLIGAFTKSADIRFMEAFYMLTLPLFSCFTNRLIKRESLEADKDTVLTHVYACLSEHCLGPTPSIPEDNFTGWCYSLIENIVQFKMKPSAWTETREGDTTLLVPSGNECWTREIYLSEEQLIEERTAELLFTDAAGLTADELKVLGDHFGNGTVRETAAFRVAEGTVKKNNLLDSALNHLLEALHLKETPYPDDSAEDLEGTS